MDSNKIWEDAIVGECVFNWDNCEYTINYGVKIQRNEMTGELKFWNTRVGSDFYKQLTTEQMINMYKFGFKIGARLVAIETMVGQVEKVNKTIRDTKREKTVKDYTANRTSMLRRIHEYSAQIKKLDGYNEEVESVIKNILC